MAIEKNKIAATDSDIESLLKQQKFYIDYFQREYRWQKKHIQQLVDDLTTTFLHNYAKEHKRPEVGNYANYYLGPIVFSIDSDSNKKSIIDGQQRVTSLILFLIYLNHKQKNNKNKVAIEELIFSEKYGEKSFNMTDEDRYECLKDLFEKSEYILKEHDSETVKNIVDRYNDIDEEFPEEIDDVALPYFIDWLINNVVVVAIEAFSDENAYAIFETMNDRGLTLTPTEMLKGFILSKITDKDKRIEIDEIWKEQIQNLHKINDIADISFFQTFLRAKYAQKIRQGKAGSIDEDFELIGSRFHNWVKDNHESMMKLKDSDDFYKYFKEEFPFYVKQYLKIKTNQAKFDKKFSNLYYTKECGIADSLQDAIFLASINIDDDDDTIVKKLQMCAQYIETFRVCRSLNYHNSGQSAIKFTMFNVIKKIRNNSLEELTKHLKELQSEIEYKIDAVKDFRLHSQNKKFVKHLLCRISEFTDKLAQKNTSYLAYKEPDGKPFEIEHLWADKIEYHQDEVTQNNEFEKLRNNIGALILIPNGDNQSFSKNEYEDKLKHYIKENTYAQTLSQLFYDKNPNFCNSLGFKFHDHMKIQDIKDRNELIKRILENLFSIDKYEEIKNL